MRVRDATMDDAAAVGEVHAESWRVGYGTRFAPEPLAKAVERRRGRWGDTMAMPGFSRTTLLVAEDDDDIVGFLHLGPSTEHAGTGEVYGFFVHPRCWGSEAAALLMDEALVRLASSGFTRAVLWTHGQGRAEGFYRKTGWAPTGREREEDFGDGLTGPVVEYGHRLP